MSVSKALLLVCIVAALHGIFFIWYQRPDWATEWSDQDGYRRLGSVLAETGKFTRFPDAPRFVPEVLRTPMYPAFVAVVYRVFGVNQLAVALTQTAVFVLIVLIVFALARRIASERIALGAAAMTALFSPLPYFGALVMTEVWTTLLFTLSMWALVVAMQKGTSGTFALVGFLVALTTLSRPVFVLFPALLAAIGFIVFPLLNVRTSSRGWIVMLVVFALSMLPWFAYNYVTLGRFTLSPAGGIGRGIWEGSWQGVWSGRLQNELTHVADDTDDRAALDGKVAAIAEREQTSSRRMLEYVHQWQDIRHIWTEPVDPFDRAIARVRADEEYRRVGIDNIRHDSIGHLARRIARGIFILWAGEIPVRYSDINALPPIVIRLCWAVQAILMAAALYGLVVLARRGLPAYAVLLGAPLVYVTAVHAPLLTEARQSLPAMPTVLLLASLGIAQVSRQPRSAHLP